jgi:branched-chain amino acid transport system ATP-binding protein
MPELDGISAGYGSHQVLWDVSLSVPEGKVVALLGANGAGKTSLLRVASGLLRASSGRMVLDGDEVTDASAVELSRRGVCHVPEGRGVFRSLTVRENLVLQARETNGFDVDRVVEAFPVLGARMRQIAGTMSGGEQQMLALSRAYLSNPRIVLLDEVSMGLAPSIVDEIFIFLEQLAREGAALLLVEQYVARALRLADLVYILNRGRLAFAGEPVELEDDDLFARYLGDLAEASVAHG